MDHPLKVAGDVAAGSIAVSVYFQWLPLILAIPSAIYACLRIFEWIEKRRTRKGD